MGYPPHGACWLWDRYLVLLHALPDFVTFAAYALIPAIAFFIYSRGHLRNLTAAYPRLWKLGAGFVMLCGLSHFGSFLQIWYGGWFYYITGINKLFMAIVSVWFTWEFWRVRNEIILAGQVLETAQRMSRDESWSQWKSKP